MLEGEAGKGWRVVVCKVDLAPSPAQRQVCKIHHSFVLETRRLLPNDVEQLALQALNWRTSSSSASVVVCVPQLTQMQYGADGNEVLLSLVINPMFRGHQHRPCAEGCQGEHSRYRICRSETSAGLGEGCKVGSFR